MYTRYLIRFLLTVAVCYSPFAGVPAACAPLSFEFSGYVDDNSAGVLFFNKSIGGQYKGRFTVDPDAPLVLSDDQSTSYNSNYFDIRLEGRSYKVDSFNVFNASEDGVKFQFFNTQGSLILRSTKGLYSNRNVPTAYTAADFDAIAEIRAEQGGWYPSLSVDKGSITEISPVLEGIDVAPIYSDFGNVKIYNKATATVKISNLGGGNLTISDIFLSDALKGFSIETIPTLPVILSNGQFAELKVTFAPKDIQLYTGAVNITSNDINEPSRTVALTGKGVPSDTPESRGFTFTKIADEQTPIPGGIGNFGNVSGPAISGKRVVFRNSGAIPYDLPYQEGIYLSDNGVLSALVDRNTYEPGSTTSKFQYVYWPSISDENIYFCGVTNLQPARLYHVL